MLALHRIAQPRKLIYSLICLHIMFAFQIIHRRSADRTPNCRVLIKHREFNDHAVEVVTETKPVKIADLGAAIDAVCAPDYSVFTETSGPSSASSGPERG